jgi:hypothetical protein
MKLIPYNRIGEVDDVGRAAVWLASDDADYVDGTSLFVDGGMTLEAVSNSRFGRLTGLVVGQMVAVYITVEAPLSGMSMNPAWSFASAAVSGIRTHLWEYLVAPPLGMLLAAQVFVWVKGRLAVRCAKMDHDPRFRCIFCEHHTKSNPDPAPSPTSCETHHVA